MTKKTALILSGGGAKGAFQCGAEKFAREVKGYQWDIIAGVSVGALNAAMLAMAKYERLFQVWNTITQDQVYTGGFNLKSLFKIFFGAKSFYSNDPLRRLLQTELEPEKIKADLRFGAVSLVSGEYVRFDAGTPNLAEAVLSSTVMPLVWSPVDVTSNYRGMVDGGVRNITPIGDVLDSDPELLVIINCSPETVTVYPKPPGNILEIGMRTLDILMNEIFQNDMREFLRINYLVMEAAIHGVTLHSPSSGRPLKYFDCKIIEPLEPLGDTLDFSQESIQRMLHVGYQRAKEVLGD